MRNANEATVKLPTCMFVSFGHLFKSIFQNKPIHCVQQTNDTRETKVSHFILQTQNTGGSRGKESQASAGEQTISQRREKLKLFTATPKS